MVTKEQAVAGTDIFHGDNPWNEDHGLVGKLAHRNYDHREFHYGHCARMVGPRGGITVKAEVWRRNGKTKTWKTRPEEFEIPIKFGLNECSYLNHKNCHQFHVASECPLNKE